MATQVERRVGKDGSVRYVARWEEQPTRWPDGRRRRHQKERTFGTEREAKRHQAAMEARRAAPASEERLADYVPRWLARREAAGWQPATAFRREASWRNHGREPLGGIALCELTREDVRRVIDGMRAKGLSASSIKNLVAVLGPALDEAVLDGLIDRNPVRGIARLGRVRGGQGRTNWWDEDQVVAFERATAAEDDAALWVLLPRTGLRIGEAIALRWADLDLGAGTARIAKTATYDRRGKQTERAGTKGGGAGRTVHLFPAVVEALRRHRVRQRARQLAAVDWVDQDRVFPNGHGFALGYQTVQARLTRLIARAGLPRITAHGFRHTAATLAILAGADPPRVQAMLGHGSVQILLEVYTHLGDRGAKEAAAKLDAFLAAAAGD